MVQAGCGDDSRVHTRRAIHRQPPRRCPVLLGAFSGAVGFGDERGGFIAGRFSRRVPAPTGTGTGYWPDHVLCLAAHQVRPGVVDLGCSIHLDVRGNGDRALVQYELCRRRMDPGPGHGDCTRHSCCSRRSRIGRGDPANPPAPGSRANCRSLRVTRSGAATSSAIGPNLTPRRLIGQPSALLTSVWAKSSPT